MKSLHFERSLQYHLQNSVRTDAIGWRVLSHLCLSSSVVEAPWVAQEAPMADTQVQSSRGSPDPDPAYSARWGHGAQHQPMVRTLPDAEKWSRNHSGKTLPWSAGGMNSLLGPPRRQREGGRAAVAPTLKSRPGRKHTQLLLLHRCPRNQVHPEMKTQMF